MRPLSAVRGVKFILVEHDEDELQRPSYGVEGWPLFRGFLSVAVNGDPTGAMVSVCNSGVYVNRGSTVLTFSPTFTLTKAVFLCYTWLVYDTLLNRSAKVGGWVSLAVSLWLLLFNTDFRWLSVQHWVCAIVCIRESVDSLCRDGTDTPYSVIQTEASKNLLTTNLPQCISFHRHLSFIFGCSATN